MILFDIETFNTDRVLTFCKSADKLSNLAENIIKI